MMIRHILVPTDFNACSTKAVALAVSMGLSLGARMTLVHVVEVELAPYAGVPFMPPIDLASERVLSAQADLESAVEGLPKQLEPNFVLRRGNAPREILALAKELEADLIIMGTHGRTGLARTFVGSTAEKVVRLSSVPVLTVHADSGRPSTESATAASR